MPAMASLLFLGPVRLKTAAGHEVEGLGPKTKALLAYLALAPEGRRERERVAGLLWADHDEAEARQNLRQALQVLRHALGSVAEDVLIADRNTIGLRLDRLDIDVRRFESGGRSDDPDVLARACALHGGPFCDGLHARSESFEEWLAIERSRLDDLAIGALRRLAKLQAAAGEVDAAIETARKLVALSPLDDEAQATLIVLYRRHGWTGPARAAFERCVELYKRELGERPGAEIEAALAAPVEPAVARIEPAIAHEERFGGVGLIGRRGGSAHTRASFELFSPSLHGSAADLACEGRKIRAEAIAETIGSIYDCVLEPSLWPATLSRITSVGESTASAVVIHGRHGSAEDRVFEHGAEQSHLRLYFERLLSAKREPMATALRSVGDFATISLLCGENEALESDFFLKWVKPLGLRDMIGVLVLRSGKRCGWFSISRSDIQARYDDRDLSVIGMLAPHICRAFLISDAFELERVAAHRLEQTINGLSTGILLAERHGRISYMNDAAERLVRAGTTLTMSNGRLTAVHPQARDALLKAVSESIDGIAPPRSGGHEIPLPDREGGGVVASVLPLEWDEGPNPLPSLPGVAAIIVQDPAASRVRAGEAFASLYGLTGAEERVLSALLSGLTPQETADALGLRLSTVKTHLQHIFDKTGATRQRDLIRLVLGTTPPVSLRQD